MEAGDAIVESLEELEQGAALVPAGDAGAELDVGHVDGHPDDQVNQFTL